MKERKATGQMQILKEGVNRCTRFTEYEHAASTMLWQYGSLHSPVGGSAFVTLERLKLEACQSDLICNGCDTKQLGILLSIFGHSNFSKLQYGSYV